MFRGPFLWTQCIFTIISEKAINFTGP